MNRYDFSFKFRFLNPDLKKSIGVGLLSILVALPFGCSSIRNDPHTTIEIPEDKFTQIEPLDMERMSVDEEQQTAQPPAELALTLEEVRAITLANNLELKVELFNPQISEANTESIEARKYEVVFDAGAAYTAADYNQNNSLAAIESQTTDLDIGLSLPLPTGGRIGLGLSDIENRLSNTNGTSTDYSTPFGFSVSQPLLKGAGRREFMHEIRTARYNSQKVRAATKLRMIAVIEAADKAYWDLYKKRKILEVRQQQYDLAKAQLERAQRLVATGQSPQVEELRSEAGLAGQLSNIITAENDLRQSQRRLKYIMNKAELPVAGSTELIPTTDADPVYYDLDQQKLISHALDNRMEMLQLALDVAVNTSTINHLRNAKLPDLTLSYMYDLDTGSLHRRNAYDELLEPDSEEHWIGLNLSFPLGRRAAKKDLLGAELERAQLQEIRINKEALIRQEVYNALDGIETSWQQILANRQSAILDGRLYQAEQRQFEIAMRTSTEVLEAQSRFANSQGAEYEALADYQIALLELARATGTLLGAAKVE